MQHIDSKAEGWPALSYPEWRETAQTLQLWTQIVGKVRLALTPWLNHGWQVPLYVSVRGLTTSAIHTSHGIAELEFDFVDHRLSIRTSEGADRSFALEPMPVSRFYQQVMSLLSDVGIEVVINDAPNEVAAPIRFSEDDVHASYDAAAAHTFWRILIQADRVFKLFRTAYLGKCSPVHFFWGSFDLAVTRFSGRAAPLHPGGVPGLPDAVTREAYSHEVSSAGFWPGSDAYPHAAFYAYAYPMPKGFDHAHVGPDAAVWAADLQEWILPYDAVRTSSDPDAALLHFLQDSYRAAADLGAWDRQLECEMGMPARPRRVAASR